ncbi:MAG: winged helix-turn-helix transcriptional regulator [Alistipes sp.]|nr:winged helix-turn-helix transcriptional regulator [Alistipes sp.]
MAFHYPQGRGIELMNDECELAGVPKPKFEMTGGCFKATFQRNDYVEDAAKGVNDKGERGVNDLNDTEIRILAIISANPSASISKIAETLSLSRKNTHKHMAGLQEKGIIKRVGPNFGGTWKINRQ